MATKNFSVYLMLSCLLIGLSSGKVFDRCELARELKNIHKAPGNQLATWVCIAANESKYNTNAINRSNKNGSRDHGIFQINDKFWCSPPGTGRGCNSPCSKFKDNDIADDFKCVQKIYRETVRLKGDGFKAWTVYETYCKGSKANKYIQGCF